MLTTKIYGSVQSLLLSAKYQCGNDGQADHHTTTRDSCDHQGREQEQEHIKA